MTALSFVGANSVDSPYRHVHIPRIIDAALERKLLGWLCSEAPWKLRIADFYEQEEFSLRDAELPQDIEKIVAPASLEQINKQMQELFDLRRVPAIVDITMHRLTAGQTIRIHNDYLDDEETHRLLIQLNEDWSPEMGGLLLIFGSDDVKDLRSVISPKSGSGFAFEISPNSFHAVTTVRSGERYTLVYTFKAQS